MHVNYKVLASWTHYGDLFYFFLFVVHLHYIFLVLHFYCNCNYIGYITITYINYITILYPCVLSRPLTLLPIQRCQDTIVALKNQLTSYASQVCSTCILEDVDTHYWADPKPFYEVSFLSFYPTFLTTC